MSGIRQCYVYCSGGNIALLLSLESNSTTGIADISMII